MKINELVEILKKTLAIPNQFDKTLLSTKINKIVIDSRKVQKDDCFIPLQGQNTDGHRYINDAFERGAICSTANISKLSEFNIAPKYQKYILVTKTTGLETLKMIAKHNAKKYIGNKVFAITGTSGKTTTKELLAFILKELGASTIKPEGGLNGIYGTSLTLANLNNYVDYGVLEYATDHFGEILEQSEICPPDTAILISVGRAHTQFLESLKGVKKAKGEIFYKAKKAILPRKLLNYYQAILPPKYLTFGYTANANLYIKNVKISEQGTSGLISYQDNNYKFSVPLIHRHILENIAAVLGALLLEKIISKDDIEKLTDIIRNFTAPKHRGELKRFRYGNNIITFADFTYNANEVSIKNAIDTIRVISTSKPILLYLGDVLELGKLTKQEHIKFANYLKRIENKISGVFLQGNYTRHTYNKLKEIGFSKTVKYSDTFEKMQKEINKYIKQLRNVFILAIGSHGMKLWQIMETWQELK